MDLNLEQKKVGKRIQEYREKAGISQESLAGIVDLSVTSISNIERGSNYPSFESFIKIANAIKASPDLLLADVIDEAYKSKASELSKMLESLSPSDRQRALTVLETLIHSITNIG